MQKFYCFICGMAVTRQCKTGKCHSCQCRERKIWLNSSCNSPKSNIKKSLTKMSEKNPMWAGDKVGYTALHNWIKRRIVKPKVCQICYKPGWLDLANKGIYDRNLENWEWICRRCHMKKDGRMVELHSKKNQEKTRKGLIKYYKSIPKQTIEEKREYHRKYMLTWKKRHPEYKEYCRNKMREKRKNIKCHTMFVRAENGLSLLAIKEGINAEK